MSVRRVVLAMLFLIGMALSGCSGVAQPAGQGSSSDGWPLALFVLLLLLALLAWWWFSGPEKQAPAAAQHAAHDGHGHQTEAGCVEFADAAEHSASAGETGHKHGSGGEASASLVTSAEDENVCYPIRGQSLVEAAAAPATVAESAGLVEAAATETALASAQVVATAEADVRGGRARRAGGSQRRGDSRG